MTISISYAFSVVLGEESASGPETIAKSAVPLRGAGAITGSVIDASGAVISTRDRHPYRRRAKISYDAVTQQDGIFSFVSVPPGAYSIRASSPGFMGLRGFSNSGNGDPNHHREYSIERWVSPLNQ